MELRLTLGTIHTPKQLTILLVMNLVNPKFFSFCYLLYNYKTIFFSHVSLPRLYLWTFRGLFFFSKIVIKL